MCKFLSASGLLVAVVGLAGCYDLSDPDGPRREDFARSDDATEQQEQQGQAADPAPAPAARNAAAGLEDDVGALLAKPQAASAAQRKLRVSTATDRD